FFPHGSFELARVASAFRSLASSTALTPWNFRLWTLIVPSSLHAAAPAASAIRTIARKAGRMLHDRNHIACHRPTMKGQEGLDSQEGLERQARRESFPACRCPIPE